MRVFGAAGQELGYLLAWGDDGFVVERGALAPRHFAGTREQIAELREDELRLKVDRLAPCDVDDAPGDWGYVAPPPAADGGQFAVVDEREWYAAADDEALPSDTGETSREVRIPLVEEQVAFNKQLCVSERLRVHKVVRTEQRTFVVPVRREEIRIERIPVDDEEASLEPGERVDAPRVTVIPVFTEEIEIRKHPVVREEVRITRSFRREEQRQTVDVRREVVEVDEGGGGTVDR
jgi:uncharacterized protein (TIGR02271 family)